MAATLKELEFSTSPPPPAAPAQGRYDVFLSFRGEDTRHAFTSHIYRSLTNAGIDTFFDAVELPRGEEISHKLLHAIRTSRFAVVILSRNYAHSKWCLQELEDIMNWRRATGQVVLPVFYHVEPSDVRAKLGPIAEAFAGHERKFAPEKVERWRAALAGVGALSGWVIGEREDEAAAIDEIVRHIMIGLHADKCLNVASFPVGLDSPLAELPSRLSDGSNGVYFLGIVGMGGIGKTSLAKAIYNNLFLHFMGANCFLANVGGKSREKNIDYMVHLQEQLLVDTAYFKIRPNRRITNVDMGINAIRSKLSKKKVLLVLDDVRDMDQIRKLAGGRDWFGSGSRIIVTTRDPDLLKSIHHLDDVYEVKPLNAHESLELFNGHALFTDHDEETEEFRKLSEQVLSYCKGIPLALEVVGGSLAGKTTEYWKNTLEQLESIPDERIQARLEISYDSLGNDRLQELFLDIACFFVGWDKDYVVMVLEACGLFAKKGIEDLIGKCLVQVDEQNKLQMNELTRDMGKEIVRKQSPNDPGERSRLWRHDEVLSTLRSHLGTKRVEGIVLNSSNSTATYANAKSFKKMKRLRLLQLDYVELHGDYGLISKELRLLYWHNFFNKYIPDDLCLEQLVAIDMQYNNLKEVFQDNQVLGNLKSLNLNHSHSLTKTPNFIKFPNLEKVTLKFCIELVYIHPSIGSLQRLASMNFRGCAKLTLEKFPDSIRTLISLENCVFSRPHPIRAPPPKSVSSGEVSKLQTPDLLSLRPELDLPPLLVHVHARLKIPMFGLTTLKTLKLRCCNVEDGAIPADISSLIYLESLDLRSNEFTSLPDTISHLPKLKYLKLDRCRNLEPEFEEFLLKEWRGNVFLPGSNIPNWFHYSTIGSSLSITIPPSWYGNLTELTVCVIYSFKGLQFDEFPHPKVNIHPLSICYSPVTIDKIEMMPGRDHMWVFHLPESFLGRLDSVNELTLNADFGCAWTVKGLGAYFPNQVGSPDVCTEVRLTETTKKKKMKMPKTLKKMLKMILN